MCGKIKYRIAWWPAWTNHQHKEVLWWKEKCLKAPTVECYKEHVEYINQFNQMANNYSMSQHNLTWKTQLFFLLLNHTTLISWIFYLHACLNILTEISDFSLGENLIKKVEKWSNLLFSRKVGRCLAETSVKGLEFQQCEQWPPTGNKVCCKACSIWTGTFTFTDRCNKCKVRLCMVWRFSEEHITLNLQNIWM